MSNFYICDFFSVEKTKFIIGGFIRKLIVNSMCCNANEIIIILQFLFKEKLRKFIVSKLYRAILQPIIGWSEERLLCDIEKNSFSVVVLVRFFFRYLFL